MKKFLNLLLYAFPIILVFSIVLLAYWPGILVSDSMVQWNQAQTGEFSDWHPAYNTIYISLLTKIWNNPGFVLFVQCVILAICVAFIMTKIEEYYKVNKIYLILASIVFALIPLNYNFAVTLLKDTLYSAFILLLAGFMVDAINDDNFLKNWKKCIGLSLVLLIIPLFRHNGIIVSLLMSIVLVIKYKKEKSIYIITISWLLIYLLMTKVGFKVLKVQEGSYANKYGPISHVIARMLNTDGVEFSDEELEILSNYVDIEKLKETYNPYNMDYSINSQNIENIKENSIDYVKLAIKKFIQYPNIVIKHYICLTSFLYSPIPFKDSYVVGMFTETDLWVYNDQYYYLNENSKIPSLLPKLKDAEIKYQDSKIIDITMRPAIYMYLSIIFICIFVYKYKNKSIFLILLPSLFNTLSLAPAIPVAMTRYVYATMLTFYIVFVWGIFEIYKVVKEKIYERKGRKDNTSIKKRWNIFNNKKDK